jgi:hypothetical protein
MSSPLLRVVAGGEPSPEELAALVTALAAAGAANVAEPPAPAPWSRHDARLRRPLSPGPDAWRWSLRG